MNFDSIAFPQFSIIRTVGSIRFQRDSQQRDLRTLTGSDHTFRKIITIVLISIFTHVRYKTFECNATIAELFASVRDHLPGRAIS